MGNIVNRTFIFFLCIFERRIKGPDHHGAVVVPQSRLINCFQAICLKKRFQRIPSCPLPPSLEGRYPTREAERTSCGHIPLLVYVLLLIPAPSLPRSLMDEQVANFIAVTGATEVQAFQMLEATGHDLEHAVQLFFAAGGDVGSGAGATDQGAGPSSSEAAPHNHHHNDDEAFARQLEQQDRGEEEPQVRAPLPSKVERLYGDFYQYDASHALRQQSQARNPVPAQVVDAFRDFSGEGGEDGGGGGGGAGDTPRATNTLASMFEPPRDLLFNGTFEQAKAFAANEGKWIVRFFCFISSSLPLSFSS